jgi:hypothetical protein
MRLRRANISRQQRERRERAWPESKSEAGEGARKFGARWIDGRVQGDREFLRVAGLDPGTRFEDPHAFAELIEGLLVEGSESVVIDVPERPG